MTSAPSTSVPEIINSLLDLTAWAVFDVDAFPAAIEFLVEILGR
ncbi:hypothetical protein [Promicromonospora sp. NPDC050249]